MSLQDDIQALSENGWQALDDSTRSRLKASIDIPTLQAISNDGWQSIDDSTKSVLRQKWSAPAEAPAPSQPNAPMRGWDDALFPTLAPEMRRQGMSLLGSQIPGAATHPVDVGRQIWPMVRDMATMPLRAVAGAGSAIGQTIGGANSLGDLFQGIGLQRPDVSEAFRSTMQDPQAEVVAQDAYAPTALRYSANPTLFSGIANDPTTLPLIMTGMLPIGGLAQGLLGSAAMYGARQLDQQSEGGNGGYAPTGLEARNALAPTLGEAIPTMLGMIPGIGKGVMGIGNTMFRRMVKPIGAEEVAGLNKALSLGLLPRLAGWSRNVGDAGEKFLAGLHSDAARVQPIVEAADRAGVKISTAEAADAGARAVDEMRHTRRLLGQSGWGKATKAWGRDVVQQPATEEGWMLLDRGIRQPANDVAFSQAHNIKSGLYPVAFEEAADKFAPKNFRIAFAKAAAQNLKGQLAAASPEYAQEMEHLAPLYGAEDAMTRAANVRGNNYSIGGLDVAGLGLPILLRTPAVAQAVWNAGRILNRAPQWGITPQMPGLLRGVISTGVSLPVGTQQPNE